MGQGQPGGQVSDGALAARSDWAGEEQQQAAFQPSSPAFSHHPCPALPASTCRSKELQKREAAKAKLEMRRLRLAPTW